MILPANAVYQFSSGILFALCIPTLIVFYLVKASLGFSVCKSTSCRNIASCYNSNPNRFSGVEHSIQSDFAHLTRGFHLREAILTEADLIQIGEANFPQLTDVADVVVVGCLKAIVDVDFPNAGHPDSVDSFYRFNSVPTEIESVEVPEFNFRNGVDDQLVEDVA